jgi:hypothetical protein
MTNRSASRTPALPPRTHASGRHARTAFGNTYNAISPRRLPFSIQMLLPHTKHPANTPPYGPSQKSCEMKGNKRANTTERVRHTLYQYDVTKVVRKVALRRAPKSAARARRGSRRARGRLKTTGTNWAYAKVRKQSPSSLEPTHREVYCNGFQENLDAAQPRVGGATLF